MRLDRGQRAEPRARAVEPAAEFGIAADDAEVDVVADGHVEKQALRLAVLGEIDDAAIDRLGGRAVVDRLAFELHRPAGARFGAVDQAREFGAAGADQAGETEHLAGVQREAGALHALSVGQIGRLPAPACRAPPGRCSFL